MNSNRYFITSRFSWLPFLAYLLFTFSVTAMTAEAQSPVGNWTFAEGTGTEAADSSGNGYTATLVNGVQWSSSPVGGAIAANAANQQYVSIPAVGGSPVNLTNTQGVTVALWVNRTYTTTGGAVLLEASADYQQSTTGFTLLPDDNTCNGLQVGLRGDVGYSSNCYRQPSSGVWHHLVVVYDKTQSGGNQVALYIDGALQNPTRNLQASTNTNSFGRNPLYVFSRGGVSDFSSGMIADLRVYDSALSAAQVQQIGVTTQSTTTQANSLAGPTGWQQGFDFRYTQSFVVDPAGSTFVLPSTVYPTSYNGTTYGWGNPGLVGASNCSTTVDARLAGINNATNRQPASFYVDLPYPGTYNIAMAMGDAGSSQCKGGGGCQVQFLDGSTVLGTVSTGQIGAGYFYDATGSKWSAAQWATKNQSKQVTLSGTRLTVLVGTASNNKNPSQTPLAYLGVTEVATNADFTISASPSSGSVAPGSQGTSTITTRVSGGFNNAISLSASGVPTGTIVSFSPNSIAAPGSGSSTMTIAVGSSTATGTYSITVTGSGGGTQHTTSVTLTVTAPADFTISAAPTSVSVAQGAQGTSTITTTVSGGFNNAISLSASGAPTGTTVSFSPNPIAAPGSGSSTMTIAVGSSTAVGTYSITVTGSGGGTQHTTSVTLTVTAPADFTISAAPTSVSVAQGAQGTSIITTTVSGGFNNAISLSASGVPTGTTVSFSPNPIAAPGSGSSTMTIAVGSSTAVGTYSVTVTGSGGGIQHTTTVTLTVIPPQVNLSWNASTSTVTGYNAYRSMTSGGPYTLLNSGLIPGTAYTDLGVQHGSTYYYVTTSVNSQGQESPYSNEASAPVP